MTPGSTHGWVLYLSRELTCLHECARLLKTEGGISVVVAFLRKTCLDACFALLVTEVFASCMVDTCPAPRVHKVTGTCTCG